jgi:hypothetical protein
MWTAKLEMRSIVVVYVNVRQSFLQDIWYVIGHAGFGSNTIEVVVVGLGNRMMRSFLYIQEEGERACTSVNLVILV